MSTTLDFPFDHVVITFPDQAAAEAASQGPLVELRLAFPSCSIIATTDPFGARVGSGGGTLAALGLVSMSGRVLIVHAGGESSRCPTQMVLGKAFTSLPVLQKGGSAEIATPLSLWLQLCRGVFCGLPVGAVVVVASDTLLQLPSDLRVDFATVAANSVIGLAVPAPLTTATNHGVYVLSNTNDDNAGLQDGSSTIRPCERVLQKPCVETLRAIAKIPPNTPESDQELPSDGQQDSEESVCSWIDTGVLVFMPLVTQAFQRLADGPLALCTRAGLTQAHALLQDETTTIVDYSRQHALKIDVYTHVLQALQLASSDNQDMASRRQLYLEQHASDFGSTVAAALFDELSTSPLQILAVPSGQFLHLGTTRELCEFLVQGVVGIDGVEDTATQQTGASLRRQMLCRRFGRHVGMVRRCRAVSLGLRVHRTTIMADTWLSSGRLQNNVKQDAMLVPAEVGPASVLEHCWVETTGIISVGRNCLVSGLRTDKPRQKDLVIPEGLAVQQVSLGQTSFVYMVLGMNDDIKGSTMLYNAALSDFLRVAGLQENDLWDADCTKRNLWTAHLHPVVPVCADGDDYWWPDLFAWLVDLKGGSASYHSESMERWKASRRLSLAEIRNGADASVEFAYRAELPKRIESRHELQLQEQANILLERRHDPVDLHYLSDGYAAGVGGRRYLGQALDMLQSVVQNGLAQKQYDVCGRTCMVLSALWGDLEQDASENADGSGEVAVIEEQCTGLVSTSFVNGEPHEPVLLQICALCKQIVINEDKHMEKSLLKIFAGTFQKLAQSMTEKCVQISSTTSVQGRSTPVYDKWVLASAPARIDLAGGWSDTPPICFEYGSAVTGMAVAVNGVKPLACRCRIVSGSSGIYLRSELRNGSDAKLVSLRETEVSSLKELRDYRDPSSDGALIKCSLLCLGLVSPEHLDGEGGDLQSILNGFCQSSQSVRLEIVVTSMLPHGSGLGTSSILGGCVLAAVARCVGVVIATDSLVDLVLLLEQHLTTGGGFQDQVNGLIGGFKTVSCQPFQFPLELKVDQLTVSQDLVDQLNRSLVLVFTGKTRLAKNILSKVLSRWSKRTAEIVSTVSRLVQGAEDCQQALAASDVNAVADCLSDYWTLKKTMAGGRESGVEPAVVQAALQRWKSEGLVRGASLCGAGGGGFLVLITAKHSGDPSTSLREAVGSIEGTDDFVWYDCCVCNEGLSVQLLEKEDSDVDTFDPSWLAMD